jgi:hypothetical protein
VPPPHEDLIGFNPLCLLIGLRRLPTHTPLRDSFHVRLSRIAGLPSRCDVTAGWRSTIERNTSIGRSVTWVTRGMAGASGYLGNPRRYWDFGCFVALDLDGLGDRECPLRGFETRAITVAHRAGAAGSKAMALGYSRLDRLIRIDTAGRRKVRIA